MRWCIDFRNELPLVNRYESDSNMALIVVVTFLRDISHFILVLLQSTLEMYYSSGGSRISPGGGVDLVGGGVDSRGGYVSKILYVKTKELGPLGGARRARPPLDPPMYSTKDYNTWLRQE